MASADTHALRRQARRSVVSPKRPTRPVQSNRCIRPFSRSLLLVVGLFFVSNASFCGGTPPTDSGDTPDRSLELTVVGNTADAIVIEWIIVGESPGGSATYKVRRCKVAAGENDCFPSFNPIAENLTNTSSYADTGLLEASTYCYRVVGIWESPFVELVSNDACASTSGAPQPMVALILGNGSRGAGDGTVTSNPPGIDCMMAGNDQSGTCSANFPHTTMVTLTAVAAGDSEFIGWGGVDGCDDLGPCMVLMDDEKFIVARFDLLPGVECGGDVLFQFSDRDFDDADWTEVDFFDTTPQMAATVDASQRNDEGNPTPSRSIKHSYCGVGGMIAGHWNTANTFNPGGTTANFVSITFDARKFPWIAGNGSDMVMRTLIKQGNSFYESGAIEVQALDLQWLTNSRTCLTPNSFNKQVGSDPNDPLKPVFSQSMQFGFTTANSNPNAGTCVVDREALVDNFIVIVQ